MICEILFQFLILLLITRTKGEEQCGKEYVGECEPIHTQAGHDKLILVSKRSLKRQSPVLFEVKACSDAHIVLSANPGEWGNNTYDIIIDGSTDKIIGSYILRNPGGTVAYEKASSILKCDEMIKFWLTYIEGRISLGIGWSPNTESVSILFDDAEPFPDINYIGVRSGKEGDNSDGEWCFVPDPSGCDLAHIDAVVVDTWNLGDLVFLENNDTATIQCKDGLYTQDGSDSFDITCTNYRFNACIKCENGCFTENANLGNDFIRDPTPSVSFLTEGGTLELACVDSKALTNCGVVQTSTCSNGTLKYGTCTNDGPCCQITHDMLKGNHVVKPDVVTYLAGQNADVYCSEGFYHIDCSTTQTLSCVEGDEGTVSWSSILPCNCSCTCSNLTVKQPGCGQCPCT